MAAYGSPEYGMTWKSWDMPSGPPICALRASGRRTSGKDFGGWPTPNAIPETRGGLQKNPEKALERRKQGHMLNLDDAVSLAGWATPIVSDHKAGASDLTNSLWRKDGKMRNDRVSYQAFLMLGENPSSSPASTKKRGALNPEFVRWLMGFPEEWGKSAPGATPSSRKSRRNL